MTGVIATTAPQGRRGFSLLEVVVAMSLFSILVVITLSWFIRQGALSRTLAQRMEDMAVIEALTRLMRDDLSQAIAAPQGGRCTVEPEQVACTTLNQVPDEPAGYHRVAWVHDAITGRLLRISESAGGQRSERVVATRFRQVAFTGSGTAVSLIVSRREGPDLTFRVWSEALADTGP